MTEWPLRTVDPALRARYLDEGWWTDDTFGTYVRAIVERDPGLTVRIWSHQRPYEGTVAELWDEAGRLAGGLSRLGVGAGDVVAYQVPNWAETIVTLWAGFRLGVVLVPIVHFYGRREVEFILRQSGARALVTVDRFGHVDHLENLAAIRDHLDGLDTVVVIGDTGRGAGFAGGHDYPDLLSGAAATPDVVVVDPDSPAMVGYTSGTTSDPKGVIHTHRTLLFEVRQLAELGMMGERPMLMASPLAHMTGMLGGTLVPMHLGVPIHLTDQWNPAEVLDIMLDGDLAAGSGATVFLTSLLDHPGFGPRHLAKIESAGLGGSPVPAAVAERAEAMGIRTSRAYGSTEHPSITGCSPDEPAVKRNRTDGRAMEGVEIRLVDDEGAPVPVGEPGEVVSRGPDLFAGYTDPAATAAVFDDGWYRTGDVGVLDDEGYLTITDRTSDIIIRGGTNISAAEAEEALMTLDGVAEVAVVAAPDERMGEHACAWLRLRPGAELPDLESVQAHLGARGLPKQKWVEELRLIADGDDFPRTPSGKIKKFELRRILREG